VNTSKEEEIVSKAFELFRGTVKQREQGFVELDRGMGRRMQLYFERHKVRTRDAEELVWDLWRKLERSVATGQFKEKGKPVVWMWVIAGNQMRDYHRKDHPEISFSDTGWDALIDTDPDLRDDSAAWVKLCIERALKQFEFDHPERAEMLSMLAQEWSGEEVADYLGISAGAARDRIYRTRLKAQEYFIHCRDET
jgi:DNA-directed RNA polymerase specialized sigma24 family protein